MSVWFPEAELRSSIGIGVYRAHQWNHLLRETLHLFGLRAELQQRQVDACAFQRLEPFGDRLRRADEARAQAPIGDRILLDGHGLLELGAGEPLLVVREPRRRGAD